MSGWRDGMESARRGYQKWRDGLRGRPVAERAWRLVILVVGLAVVAVGVVLLPLPGPGWVLIFLGLGILAAEYAWAHRLLLRARGYYRRLKEAAQRRRTHRVQR